jgi:spore germination protein GerM
MSGAARNGGGGRRLWVVLGSVFLVAIVALAIVLVPLLGKRGGEEAEETAIAPSDTAGAAAAGVKPTVLVFANDDGTAWVTENRQLPPTGRLEDSLRAAMEALCAGPTTSGPVQTIPAGTHPLAVFYDEKSAAIVLDFSPELTTNHPGGTDAERATIDAILRTVALNFPQVHSCQILVNGQQLDTLAGHIRLDKPLDPRRAL